jgi:thiosulfate reductase cytochrome b subunit
MMTNATVSNAVKGVDGQTVTMTYKGGEKKIEIPQVCPLLRSSRRGFPAWATLPAYQDLATGRRWHFIFAWALVINGAIYLLNLFALGHIRDIHPSARDLRSLQSLVSRRVLANPVHHRSTSAIGSTTLLLVATAQIHSHGLITRRDGTFGPWAQTPIAIV